MDRDRWLVGWALGSVALGATSVLVPLAYVGQGGDAIGLGILAGAAAAAGAPGALLAGWVADRTGVRWPIVLASLGSVALALGAMAWWRWPTALLVGNTVVWFAAGAAAPVLTLLVTVGHPERHWTDRFGRLNVYGGWGWAAGLVLGTVWSGVGDRLLGPATAERTLFLACATCALAGGLVVVRSLPTDVSRNGRTAARLARAGTLGPRLLVRTAMFPLVPGRFYWLLKSFLSRRRGSFTARPALAWYLLAVFATFVGFGIFWGPLPLYLREVGYGGGAIFAFYLLSSLGSALFYAGAGRLAGQRDAGELYGAALLARAALHPGVAVVALVAAVSVAAAVVTGAMFLLMGVAWAVLVVTSAAIVTSLAPQDARGGALGLYTAVSALGHGVGSVLGGWLGSVDFPLAFAVAGGLVGVGAVIVLALWLRGATARPAARA